MYMGGRFLSALRTRYATLGYMAVGGFAPESNGHLLLAGRHSARTTRAEEARRNAGYY
jgi:hypothetical protein